MSDFPPINYRWEGDCMEPVGPRAKAEADKQFIIGGIYRLAEEHGRSQASHAHQFAWLHEAWQNLPEGLAEDYPTSEHLRKAALIQGGYFTETITDVGSNAAAVRMAALVKARDQFCVCIVRRSILVVRDPMSQSKRAMGAQLFNESKQAILEIVAGLIGVEPGALIKSEAA